MCRKCGVIYLTHTVLVRVFTLVIEGSRLSRISYIATNPGTPSCKYYYLFNLLLHLLISIPICIPLRFTTRNTSFYSLRLPVLYRSYRPHKMCYMIRYTLLILCGLLGHRSYMWNSNHLLFIIGVNSYSTLQSHRGQGSKTESPELLKCSTDQDRFKWLQRLCTADFSVLRQPAAAHDRIVQIVVTYICSTSATPNQYIISSTTKYFKPLLL